MPLTDEPTVLDWSRIMAAQAHGHESPTPTVDEAQQAAAIAKHRYTYPGTAPTAEDPWALAPSVKSDGIAVPIMEIQASIKNLMLERHRKYGPGNIAEFGTTGILVRMADKFARLKAGQGNFDDETVDNTLDDIIGYALIWKLWNQGDWPGAK